MRYIVLRVDADDEVVDGEHLEEILRDALVVKGGPFRSVEVSSDSDIVWNLVVDGTADYAPDVYDDIDETPEKRAADALNNERNSILGENSADWLRSLWDGDPPKHVMDEVAKSIREGDEREKEAS